MNENIQFDPQKEYQWAVAYDLGRAKGNPLFVMFKNSRPVWTFSGDVQSLARVRAQIWQMTGNLDHEICYSENGKDWYEFRPQPNLPLWQYK